jgi:hypothetical protein
MAERLDTRFQNDAIGEDKDPIDVCGETQYSRKAMYDTTIASCGRDSQDIPQKQAYSTKAGLQHDTRRCRQPAAHSFHLVAYP